MTASRIGERFTAWTACPSCGNVDCHAIRPPDPTVKHEGTRTVVQIQDWAGHVIRRVESGSPPLDESLYEVVRICACGQEWGEERIDRPVGC